MRCCTKDWVYHCPKASYIFQLGQGIFLLGFSISGACSLSTAYPATDTFLVGLADLNFDLQRLSLQDRLSEIQRRELLYQLSGCTQRCLFFAVLGYCLRLLKGRSQCLWPLSISHLALTCRISKDFVVRFHLLASSWWMTACAHLLSRATERLATSSSTKLMVYFPLVCCPAVQITEIFLSTPHLTRYWRGQLCKATATLEVPDTKQRETLNSLRGCSMPLS